MPSQVQAQIHSTEETRAEAVKQFLEELQEQRE